MVVEMLSIICSYVDLITGLHITINKKNLNYANIDKRFDFHFSRLQYRQRALIFTYLKYANTMLTYRLPVLPLQNFSQTAFQEALVENKQAFRIMFTKYFLGVV